MNQRFKKYLYWSLGFLTIAVLCGFWTEKLKSNLQSTAEIPQVIEVNRPENKEVESSPEQNHPLEDLMAQAAHVLSTGPAADTKADAQLFAERLREQTEQEQVAYDKKAGEIREEITKFHALKEELNQAIMDQRGPEETTQLNEAFEEKARYILRQQAVLNQLYQNLAQAYDQVITSVTENK